MSDTTILVLVAAALTLGLGAWAGWSVGGWRRRRRPTVPPYRVWLCDACYSFNDALRIECYHCRQPRPADARMVVPDREFHVEQRLGRAKASVSWGGSRPWLGADEPLRDAWLAGHPAPETEPDTSVGERAETSTAPGEEPGSDPRR